MLIGHQEIIAYLQKVWLHKTLSQAYLFVGPEHVGKMAVAKWLTDQLLGVQEPVWEGKINPDQFRVSKIEDKKEISIDQIRKLRQFIQQKPFISSRKVAVIERLEDASIQAVNALLKNLEE